MKFIFVRIVVTLGVFVFLVGSGFSQEACSEPGSIKRIKNRRVGNTEYVIFDVIKRLNAVYDHPAYSVKTVSAPFTDYSGEEKISVNGDKFKKIVFKSLNWMCKSRETFSLPKRSVKDFKMLWAFEGIAEFVVGYNARSRYVSTYHYDVNGIRKVVMKFRR